MVWFLDKEFLETLDLGAYDAPARSTNELVMSADRDVESS
jgi:hypothetical protein